MDIPPRSIGYAKDKQPLIHINDSRKPMRAHRVWPPFLAHITRGVNMGQLHHAAMSRWGKAVPISHCIPTAAMGWHSGLV